MNYRVILNGENLVCIKVQLGPEFTATTTKVQFNLVCAGDGLSDHAIQCADVLAKLVLEPRPGDADTGAVSAAAALNNWIEQLRAAKFNANDELVFETAYRYGNAYLTLEIEPIYED